MSEIQCYRCGRMIPNTSTGSHIKSCLKMPRPNDLAQMMDDDPLSTPNSMANLFGVSYASILLRLEGTHWTPKRLSERTKYVRREHGRIYAKARLPGSPRNRIWVPDAPHCPRCMILNHKQGLCEFCRKEIEAKVEREIELRPWDTPYVAGVMAGMAIA